MSRLPRSLAPLFALVTLISTPALLGAAPQGAAGGAPPVFEVVSDGFETRSAEEPEAVVAVLRVDHGLIQRDPDAMSVPLPGGGVATARRTWWNWVSADEYSWFGELDGAAGSVAFHYYDGRLIGSVRTGDAEYRLVPVDGLHRMVRSAAPSGSCGVGFSGSLADLHTGDEPDAIGEGVRAIAAAATETDCVTPATNVTVDLMVLYPLSPGLTATAVNDYAFSSVAEANSLFAQSGVKITYSLRYVGPITGDQPPSEPDSSNAPATRPVLDWLNAQFATPAIDTEVEMLRIAHGADMIVIVVPLHPEHLNCGVANLVELHNNVEVMYQSTVPFGNKAFSVVELECGNPDYTFAHELGHNYGMRHNGNLDVDDILPWAYGHELAGSPAKATVMACTGGQVPCDRIPRFSNPDIDYEIASGVFVPTGVHSNQPGQPAHNACVANLRRTKYRNFAQRPPTTPPTLTITSPADGATVQAGVAFNLVASASDAQDGNLASQVQWTSDRDGFLGTGSPRSATLTSRGPHLITATVTDSSGTTVPYSIRLTVPDTDPPRRYIDSPSHNQVVTGTFLLQGWATDASGVDPDTITFKVDGVTVIPPSFDYGTHRAGVCSVHGDLNDPNCPYVGFTGFLDASQFPPGTHTLTMTVKDVHGNTSTFNRIFRSAVLALFDPTADAWVSEAQPNANFGSDSSLQMRASGSGQAKHAYMKFSVSGITRPVLSAKLRVFTQSTAFSWYSLYWMQVNNWSESGITWNNASLAHYLNIQYGFQPASSAVELDVTPIVSGNGTYTFGMVGPDVPGLAIHSRNTVHPSASPRLEILH